MILKRNLYYLTFAFALISFSCAKEVQLSMDGPSIYKDGEVLEQEIPCEYILDPAPQPLISLIDSDDPVEDKLNLYLYLIAKATSRYTCTVDFETAFNAAKFNRYSGAGDGPVQDEATIDELIALDPNYQNFLIAEFNAVGEDWNVAKGQFSWKGFDYTPTIWLENKAYANWDEPELIGVGTDIEYAKEFLGDFVPAFYNDCIPEEYEPTEMVLGKVDTEDPIDTNVTVQSTCVTNPILIVQLSWDETVQEKSRGANINPDWLGTNMDTLIPLISPPGCAKGSIYDMLRFNPDCNRFERGRRSEARISIWDIPTNHGNPSGYQSLYLSRKEDLLTYHKNDKCKSFAMWTDIKKPTLKDVQLGGDLGAMGSNVYLMSFEYDWYASWRGWAFPKDQGITPRLGMQRKASHEHYQIVVIKPADWCEDRVKYFQSPHNALHIWAHN